MKTPATSTLETTTTSAPRVDNEATSQNGVYTRRTFLAGAATVLLASSCRPLSPAHNLRNDESHDLARIEARIGGRLGVFALDTGSEQTLSWRSEERFAMCSVFKWLLAGAVLAAADRGELVLSEEISFGQEDLLEHSPVTAEQLASGALAIDALAEAAVVVSDNAAANLLRDARHFARRARRKPAMSTTPRNGQDEAGTP